MYEFKLPDLGEGIHEGEVLKWHVSVGQALGADEPLVDVETDKAAVTIPAPYAGSVVSQNGAVGDVVKVGDVIAVIDRGERSSADEPMKRKTETPDPPPSGPAVRAESRALSRVIAAPATRRLARELGVDIYRAKPSGPAGRVTADDVRALASGPGSADDAARASPTANEPMAVSPERGDAPTATSASGIPFLELSPMPDFSHWGPVEKTPLRSIRRRVARKMVTSMVLVPHVAHMDEADVTQLEAFRHEERERRQGKPGGRLTLLPFVVKAVTAGLKAAPSFNASLDPIAEEIIFKKFFNIGVAVDTGQGLVVPVIRDTDRQSIIQVSGEIERLAEKARHGSLDVEELQGGTFTITNIGPLGGTALIPAINYPEVAILGLGRVQEKPVVRDGEIVIRTMLPLTLSFDHRVADGADAARFVGELVRQLSDPNLLLLET